MWPKNEGPLQHCWSKGAFIAQVWQELQKSGEKWISLHKNDWSKKGGHYRINKRSNWHLHCTRLIVEFFHWNNDVILFIFVQMNVFECYTVYTQWNKQAVTIIQLTVKNAVKTHYFYRYKLLLVYLPHHYVSYIVVFSTMSSTFGMSSPLLIHASLKWYQWCHEWCHHGHQPSAKKNGFI